MRLTRAEGSSGPEVARDRWHRSRTAWRGASAAPSSRAVSRSGARTPAPVSSVTLGPDNVPVRRAASVPGSCSRRCPLTKVCWAWPTPIPSSAASITGALRWPRSRQIPEASIRGASKVLPALVSRSRPTRDP